MTPNPPRSLVAGLVSKGHRIEVLAGQLIIESRSDKTIPDNWLPPRRQIILSELASLLDRPLFSFSRYSTGKWGKTKVSGVNLIFQDHQRSDAAPFIIFDAGTTHQKDSPQHQKGSPLPEGQFWLKNGSHFWRLWARLKLPQPDRPCLIWKGLTKRMTPLVLTARYANMTSNPNKLDKNSLELATITEADIIRALEAHTIGTPRARQSNSNGTEQWNITTSPNQTPRALQPIFTTGTDNPGNRLTGKREPSMSNRGNTHHDDIDSWLSEYERSANASDWH
jgi:hypothetical protein